MQVSYARRSIMVALAALIPFLGALWVPTAQGAPSAPPLVMSGQILVKFHATTRAVERATLHRAQGGQRDHTIPGIDVEIVRVPAGAEHAMVAAYAHHPLVEYAELDPIARALEVVPPNDPGFPNQWGMHNTGQSYKDGLTGTPDADIDAPEAWNVLATSGVLSTTTTVVIAILDSGIDLDHVELHEKISASYDLTGSPHGANDMYGHGTPIAGIAAATPNNAIGVTGVGYNAQLLNVKVLDDNAYGANSRIADGIVWAADHGAHVINLSLGSSTPSRSLERAVNYAWSKGAVLACAGGNGGDQSATYPGRYANCIAVAATDSTDTKAAFSSWNSAWMDVAAPGLDIYSTYPNHTFKTQATLGRANNYDYGYGTSTAVPQVAGLAALVWSTDRTMSNQAVRDCIERAADPIAGTGTYWIHGRINASTAVSPGCSPAGAEPTPPPDAPTGMMAVRDIAWDSQKRGSSYTLETTVTIGQTGSPSVVADATVEMTLTDPTGAVQQLSGTTDATGQARFTVTRVAAGTYTAKVTNLTHATLAWDASQDQDTPVTFTIR